MSNFSGHYKGGLISATTLTAAVFVGNQHFHWNLEIIAYPCIWCNTLFFSLFPDVDIKSTPSKMFYRAVFIVLCILYFLKKFESASLVAILSITPQMTKHRGFFHHKLTALTLPGYSFLLYSQHYIGLQFAIFLYIAGVIGYYTHLFLDGDLI